MHPNRSRNRHIPLGKRLTVLEKIRRGDATIEGISGQLAIPQAEILEWLHRHKDDRWTCVSEIVSGGHAVGHLQRRVKRLLQLVDDADLELRRLHRRVFAALQISESPPDAQRG